MKKQYNAPIFESFPLTVSDILTASGLTVRDDNGVFDVGMEVDW